MYRMILWIYVFIMRNRDRETNCGMSGEVMAHKHQWERSAGVSMSEVRKSI